MSSSVRPSHVNLLESLASSPCSTTTSSVASIFSLSSMSDPNRLGSGAKNGLRISKRGLAHKIGETTEVQPAKFRKSSLQMPITKYLHQKDQETEDRQGDRNMALMPSRDLNSRSRLKPHSKSTPTLDINPDSSCNLKIRDKKSTPTVEIGALDLGSPDSVGTRDDTDDSRPRGGRRQSSRLSQVLPGNSGDKKHLRSHGHTGWKSLLAKYFANYQDVMTGAQGLSVINPAEALITIITEPEDEIFLIRTPLSSLASRPGRVSIQVAQFSAITVPANQLDPLGDDLYLKAHKQAERREKHYRTLEKEHLQHEKNQLLQLLGDLNGPRWQQVMGISGMPDASNRDWELKRDFFISQLEELVSKFRIWKEEEKLLKDRRAQVQNGVEPDLLFPPLASSEDGSEPDSDVEPSDHSDDQSDRMDVDRSSPGDLAVLPSSASPNDIPTRRPVLVPISLAKKASSTLQIRLQRSLLPPEPFTSFFSQPQVRTIGPETRNDVWAFGIVVPDMSENDFEPPADLITGENLKAHARRRRRLRRESRPSLK